MARGITSFSGYSKTHNPGGTYYGCVFCKFGFYRQRGNALGMHSKAVARIKKHVEEKHPAPKAEPEVKPYDGRYSRPIKIF